MCLRLTDSTMSVTLCLNYTAEIAFALSAGGGRNGPPESDERSAFRHATRTASTEIGLMFGLIHAWIAAMGVTLLLWLLKRWNAEILDEIAAHMSTTGAAALLIGQVVYGMVVGVVYGRSPGVGLQR